MKGYKILNADYRAYPDPINLPRMYKQYTVPGEFEEDVMPFVGNRGMHFSLLLIWAMAEKTFCDKSKFVEVESYGKHDFYRLQVATDKLRIIRELSLDEVLEEITKELEESKSDYREFAEAFDCPEKAGIFTRLKSYDPVKFSERTGIDFEWAVNYWR